MHTRVLLLFRKIKGDKIETYQNLLDAFNLKIKCDDECNSWLNAHCLIPSADPNPNELYINQVIKSYSIFASKHLQY